MSLHSSKKAELRRSDYKATVNADDGRRRREENTIQIRKAHREESLLKKRCEEIPQTDVGVESDVKLESLPAMVAAVYSNDYDLQLESMKWFRRLLAVGECPIIDEVIRAGVVPRFVEFLTRDHNPQLQFEATRTLANIACGTSENTNVVIEHGAVPIFVKLLSSTSVYVSEQAVLALGNVAGDSSKCRDIVLSNGALFPLLMRLNEHAELSMLRNVAWTLSNFCRGKPQPEFDQVKPALPALQRLIHSNDEGVLSDACWALSYLSDGPSEKIQAVLQANICPRLLELLMHPSPSVIIPALRTIGNIVTGDDLQTQFVIDHQALHYLRRLLTQNHKKSIKELACRTISNITAGNKEQIQAVIDEDIIGPLVFLLQTAEFDVKKEAAWAIYNATCGGDPGQVQFLVSRDCIKSLCDLLTCSDPCIVAICLGGLENILKVGKEFKNLGYTGNVNKYAQMIKDAEGLEKIETLQSHDNPEIYDKSVKILETYWIEEDEDMLAAAETLWQLVNGC